jgi:hypothetical protein
MSAARYALGLLLTVASLLPLVIGARRVRARLVPELARERARLAEVVVVLAGYVLVGEVLGTVGLFRAGFVVAGCIVVGSAEALACGPTPRSARALSLALDPWTVALSVATGAAVFAQWCSGTIGSLRRGMVGDTLVYHGPFAARFGHDGWVTRLHFVAVGQVIPFHPATSELLHGTAILFFGTDFLSPLLNLGWLAFTLLAAWCIGTPRGVGPVTMAAVALPLSGRFIAISQAGTGVNDIVVVAFFLAAVALVLAVEARPGSLVLGGLAAGLAAGTKFTAVFPVAVLAVAVIVVGSGRARRAITFGLPLLLGGSFWYLRNLIRVGNPIPSAHIAVGPISLPSPRLPVTESFSATVAGNLHALGPVAGAAFDLSFGRLWFVVLALAAAGAALAVALDASVLRRALGVVALVAAAGYLFTPTTGLPSFFGLNLRYVLPALALGLALLPSVPLLSSTARQRVIALGLLVVVVLNVAPANAWADGRGTALVVTAVAAVVVTAAVTLRRARPALLVLGAVILVAALAVGGRVVERRYLRNRYAHDPTELGQAYKWFRSVRHQRVAVAGTPDQYPFYGLDLSNVVDYMGVRGPHGEYSAFRRCRDFRQALARGRYRYVVAFPNVKADPEQPPEAGWTKADPSAREVLRAGRASVFRIDGPVTVADCG